MKPPRKTHPGERWLCYLICLFCGPPGWIYGAVCLLLDRSDDAERKKAKP